MKIGITGSKGFLGKHLIVYLKKFPQYSIQEFNTEKYSLFNPMSMRGFIEKSDCIIHLAGANRDTNFQLINVNTLGTAGLMEAVSQYNPSVKVIFASTSQVYNQQNIYALSKKQAEEIIKRYAKLSSIPAIILRIANIYGPGGKPNYNSVIATFVNKIRHNEKITINGDGTQTRDYIFVEDVVRAIQKSIVTQIKKTEIIDICSGKQTSLRHIVDILQKIHGFPLSVQYNKAIITKDSVIIQDVTKAKKVLGWEANVTLEKGLQKTLLP